MSAWTCRPSDGKADPKIVPPRSRIPCWKGLGADSEEKHEPASDIDTVVMDSLKALDPNRPIREADIAPNSSGVPTEADLVADRDRSPRTRAIPHGNAGATGRAFARRRS